jgi:hypothetical protein
MYKTIAMVCALLILTIIGEVFLKRILQIIAKPIATYIFIPVILLGAIGGCAALYRYGHLVLCRNTFEAERWILDIPFRKGMPIPNLCYSL